MVRNAISNVYIETLAFSYSDAYMNSPFFTYSLANSKLKNLIFKNSRGFTGFTEIDYPSMVQNNRLGIEVENLLIDQSPNFVLSETSLPPFDGLYSLSITASSLNQIPRYSFVNLKSLASLNLNGNVLTDVTSDSFEGLESHLAHLDLSHNPLTNLDWNVFQKFTALRVLDLSYTNISTIHSSLKIWPRSNNLTLINLSGYNFNTLSICTLDSNEWGQKLNLSKTLIQLDANQECNCFVFYIYNAYRLNPENNPLFWITTNSTPQCYRNLYYTNPYQAGFQEIERREKECNFKFILNTICARPTNPVQTTRPYETTQYTTASPIQTTKPYETTVIPTEATTQTTQKPISIFTLFPTLDPNTNNPNTIVPTQYTQGTGPFPTDTTPSPFTQYPTIETATPYTLLPTGPTPTPFTIIPITLPPITTQFPPVITPTPVIPFTLFTTKPTGETTQYTQFPGQTTTTIATQSTGVTGQTTQFTLFPGQLTTTIGTLPTGQTTQLTLFPGQSTTTIGTLPTGQTTQFTLFPGQSTTTIGTLPTGQTTQFTIFPGQLTTTIGTLPTGQTTQFTLFPGQLTTTIGTLPTGQTTQFTLFPGQSTTTVGTLPTGQTTQFTIFPGQLTTTIGTLPTGQTTQFTIFPGQSTTIIGTTVLTQSTGVTGQTTQFTQLPGQSTTNVTGQTTGKKM